MNRFAFSLLFHVFSFHTHKKQKETISPAIKVSHGGCVLVTIFPLGSGHEGVCVFIQAWWEATAQEISMAHSVPLWCPMLLVPLAAYSCLVSSSSMSSLPSPLDIVSAPLPSPLSQDPLWGSRRPVEQSWRWALTLPIHFACEQHWSRDGADEWPMSKWRCETTCGVP